MLWATFLLYKGDNVQKRIKSKKAKQRFDKNLNICKIASQKMINLPFET